MLSKHILYPFLVVLIFGSSLHSAPSHDIRLCTSDARIGQGYSTFSDNTDIIDLIEEDFPGIEEDNSTEEKDDNSNSERQTDDFGSLPWFCPPHPSELLSVSHGVLSTRPPALHSVPVYLLNRVFRL